MALVIITLLFSCLIAGPLTIAWNYVYWRNRKHPVINKRFYTFVLFSNIPGVLVYISLWLPCMLVLHCFAEHRYNNTGAAVIANNIVFYNVIFFVVTVGNISRGWHLLYSMRHAHSISNSKWKHLIGFTNKQRRQQQQQQQQQRASAKHTALPLTEDDQDENGDMVKFDERVAVLFHLPRSATGP